MKKCDIVHQRFHRWRANATWEKPLEILADKPYFERLMIDASHCKVHPHIAETKGGKSCYEPHKKGLNIKDSPCRGVSDMPLKVLVAKGARADCKQIVHMIKNFYGR